MARSLADERETAYVSTGHLPGPETVQLLVNEAQTRRSIPRASRVICSASVSSEPAGRSTAPATSTTNSPS